MFHHTSRLTVITCLALCCCLLATLANVQNANGQVVQKLIPANGSECDSGYGSDVAIDGTRVIVGAYEDNTDGANVGAAYIFEWNGSQWVETAKLLSENDSSDECCGWSVDIKDDHVIVGALLEDPPYGLSGAAYIFEWDGSTWTQTAKLLPGDEEDFVVFGATVSINGNRAIVGSPSGFLPPGISEQPSAYIFERDGDTWTQTAKLLPDDGDPYTSFGFPVSIDGDRAFVGAQAEDGDSQNAGAVYVFEWDGTTWHKATKLFPQDSTSNDFGRTLSPDSNRLIVGATDDNDNGGNSGSAYIFEWDGSTWTQTAKLLPDDGASGDHFGNSVSLNGNRVLVGASGSAYIFEWNGSTWIQTAKLLPDEDSAGYRFGFRSSLDGSHAIVANSCEVYAYDLSTGTDIERNAAGPETLALHAGYPNPFNTSTRITLDLPEVVHVRLTIYDLQGRKVQTVTDRTLPAGPHRFRWNAGNQPAGIYLVRMEAGSYSKTRPIVLVK